VAGLADGVVAAPVIRTLLAGAIDYAGLFPPAALAMNEAVRNYASYRAGPASWALARFVAPIARLGELREASRELLQGGLPWRVAALAGAGGAEDWPAAASIACDGLVADALELRAQSGDDVVAAARRLPPQLDVFYEVPIDTDPAPLVAVIGRVGGKAKVRTGGVTSDAFPHAMDVARFIVACARAGVPFKATAGLHHAIRASYRLTYDEHSPRGEMFGFLNVLVASVFAHTGLGAPEVSDILAERDAGAFRFLPDAVEWGGRQVTREAVAQARVSLALSFGSCSFTEPIEELRTLGLL
jgi:hypothetical protein